MTDQPTLFLVDDHQFFLTGLRTELGGHFNIVGEASDAETATAQILQLRPELVLLDVHLPGGGGQSVLEHITPELPDTKVLALSVSDAAEDVIGVIRAGARGYVTKSISPDELVDAINRVHDGDSVFSPRLAGFVLDAFRGEIAVPIDTELDQLTAREQEVMRLIARGFAYKEVAAELHVSVKTVETHMSAVLRKLQFSNRHELAVWANNRRLI